MQALADLEEDERLDDSARIYIFLGNFDKLGLNISQNLN